MTSETIASSSVVAAEIDGGVVGVAQLKYQDNSVAELDKLFVEPRSMRSGAGRLLLGWAKTKSRAIALIVDSDPYAAAFYRRCGAIDVGLVPSGSIPGRFLPRLSFLPAIEGMNTRTPRLA